MGEPGEEGDCLPVGEDGGWEELRLLRERLIELFGDLMTALSGTSESVGARDVSTLIKGTAQEQA